MTIKPASYYESAPFGGLRYSLDRQKQINEIAPDDKAARHWLPVSIEVLEALLEAIDNKD